MESALKKHLSASLTDIALKLQFKIPQPITLLNCIHDVPGSNFGRDTDRTVHIFVVLISPSRALPT